MSTALITGASSGIGAAFAQALATRQIDLVLVARSEDKLRQLAQQLQAQYPIQVEVLVQDLTAPGAAKSVFEAVTQKNIAIDLLINNAGFGTYGPFSESSLSKQLEMIQLNILSLVDLTYQFLPQMQQRGSGSIINLSSIAGFQPLPYMSVYAATKAFVLNFSEALWAENQDKGVKVIAVCPGPTQTNFFDIAGFDDLASSSSENQRSATPESVVRDALKALEGDASTVVTGGLPNQIIVNLPRLFPRDTLVKLVEQQFRPKRSTN
ncbi:MAG TPA: SDR family oxidoreductase [Candidatus Sericytochromatia bacterium]